MGRHALFLSPLCFWPLWMAVEAGPFPGRCDIQSAVLQRSAACLLLQPAQQPNSDSEGHFPRAQFPAQEVAASLAAFGGGAPAAWRTSCLLGDPSDGWSETRWEAEGAARLEPTWRLSPPPLQPMVCLIHRHRGPFFPGLDCPSPADEGLGH